MSLKGVSVMLRHFPSTRFLSALLLTALLVLLLPPGTAQAAEPAAWDNIVAIYAGEDYSLGLRADGRVAWAGCDASDAIRALSGWRDIQSLELQGWENYVVGYRSDGSVALTSLYGWDGCDWREPWTEQELAGWTNVKKLRINGDLCVGLQRDGHVLAATKDREAFGALVDTVQRWQDVRDILVYYDLVVGLKTDGTIVTNNPELLHDQGVYWGGSWGPSTNWTQVKCLVDSLIGPYAIKTDGSVLGIDRPGWDNVDSLYFNCDSMFALRRDGSVASNFSDYYEYYEMDPRLQEVAGWTNITALGFDDEGMGRYVPLGLCSDGTVKAVTTGYEGEPYGEWDVSGWTNVKTLYSGTSYTFGLRPDGSILATGGEFSTLPWISAVAAWTDIAAIAVGRGEAPHVLGLRFDGTVVSCGNNDHGQCSVR